VEHRSVTERGDEEFAARGEEGLTSGSKNGASDSEDGITEIPRAGSSLPQRWPRTRSPVRYTTGESRTLRIQTG
jgi:hypothetical protein